jgi:hypothetical protein
MWVESGSERRLQKYETVQLTPGVALGGIVLKSEVDVFACAVDFILLRYCNCRVIKLCREHKHEETGNAEIATDW